jgi:hypothetical protein
MDLPVERDFGFESRQGRTHFVAKRRYLAGLVFLLTTFGYGLTILKPWDIDEVGIHPKRYARNAHFLLKCAPFVRNIEIRISWMDLDFSKIPSRHLRGIHFMTGVEGQPDISRFQNLEVLASPYDDIRKIQGIENLHKLRHVQCQKPGLRWLQKLPNSLQILDHSGLIPINLDLNRLLELKEMSVTSLRVLDIATMPQSDSLEQLIIAGVQEIRNISALKSRYPNLRSLALEKAPHSSCVEAQKRFPDLKIEVWDGLND